MCSSVAFAMHSCASTQARLQPGTMIPWTCSSHQTDMAAALTLAAAHPSLPAAAHTSLPPPPGSPCGTRPARLAQARRPRSDGMLAKVKAATTPGPFTVASSAWAPDRLKYLARPVEQHAYKNEGCACHHSMPPLHIECHDSSVCLLYVCCPSVAGQARSPNRASQVLLWWHTYTAIHDDQAETA